MQGVCPGTALEGSVDALSLPAGLRGSSSSIRAFMPKTQEH